MDGIHSKKCGVCVCTFLKCLDVKKDLCKLAALVFPNTHYFKEHFKVIYFKNIDAVHDALEERFDQVFLIFSNAELK